MDTAHQILATLKDVGGVHGSFVVTRDGDLFARDIAEMLTSDLLAEVAPRVVRIGDAFAAEGGQVMSCLVRYADHALFLRGMTRGTLCVLTVPEINMPALKMGANLAVRRLGPLLERMDTPMVEPEPVAASTSPALPARLWRGSVVKPTGE
jgi:predicted regulator of Ras-like GTPase activity (Roadblock/LC7/MglB family)